MGELFCKPLYMRYLFCTMINGSGIQHLLHGRVVQCLVPDELVEETTEEVDADIRDRGFLMGTFAGRQGLVQNKLKVLHEVFVTVADILMVLDLGNIIIYKSCKLTFYKGRTLYSVLYEMNSLKK